jgi:hypothetical protein
MIEEDEDEFSHVNTDETDEEAQDTCPASNDDLDSDVDDITIEEGDRVFMTMVHPVNPQHFVRASSTVSRHLAEAFAQNSKLKDFHDIVPMSLHTYANVFRYPLPLIDNLIHWLKGARYFTNLDVCWGYNNVRIREGDEWKATFRTNRGLFEPLVMYFGLTNSLATFQTMMNEIFQDLITEGIISIYLDDILIFTNSLEEHHWITRLVLDCMREHKLYLRPEKCEFEKTKIEYLGIIILHNKVEMDPVNIARVVDWPTPSNKKEVQSFVGFINFY